MANILVVDDSIVYRQIMKETLIKGGHTVVGEAENGLEAVERYKELNPDITTMDINMPEIDGLRALQYIREFDPKAIVVMVSSTAKAKKMARAASLGATDFLPKPFEASKILDVISRMASLAELSDEEMAKLEAELDLEHLLDDIDVDLDVDLYS